MYSMMNKKEDPINMRSPSGSIKKKPPAKSTPDPSLAETPQKNTFPFWTVGHKEENDSGNSSVNQKPETDQVSPFADIPIEDLKEKIKSRILQDFLDEKNEQLDNYIGDLVDVIKECPEVIPSSVKTADSFIKFMSIRVSRHIKTEEALTANRIHDLDNELRERLEQYKKTDKKTDKKINKKIMDEAETNTKNRKYYLIKPLHEFTAYTEPESIKEGERYNFYQRDNKFFYHTTPEGNLPSILKNGLDPQQGGNSKGITAVAGKEKDYKEQCIGKIHISDFFATADTYKKPINPNASSNSCVILRFPQAFLSWENISIDPSDKFTALTIKENIPSKIIEVFIESPRKKWESLQNYCKTLIPAKKHPR